MTITTQQLEARLWGAANALRGPVEPADFKAYVFPMLFWKWLSDNYEWERAQAVADFGDDVEPEVEADYHRFAIPDGTRWSEVTTKTANLGTAINKALGAIEQANPDTLAGIFGDVAWGNKERLPETALVNMLNEFNGLNFNPDETPHDLLGGGYEYLLKNFADESGKKAGEFFTPRQVVRLLVRILDPQPGEAVYDPASGSGGMLVETINTVRDHGGDTRTLRLYGQEVNLTTSAIARMNLFLHDIEDFKIVRGDTLRKPGLRDPDGKISEFDVVLANPPFSLKNWGSDTWAADPRSFCGVPPDKNADMAWIQHMITSMKPETGRVGVVMPHGVLFRGDTESKIRKCLIERDQLEAVIGLPDNLFYSTSIPACLLIFRASKPVERKEHVLFVDGSARFLKGQNQNEMTDEDVAVLLEAYETGEDPDGDGGVNVRLVPHSEIEANGWVLSLTKYIEAATEEASDLRFSLEAYQEARKARIRSEVALFDRIRAAGLDADVKAQGVENEVWAATTLGEVATLAIGRTPPRKEGRYWTTDLERPFCTIADMNGRVLRPAREGVTELAETEGKAKRIPAGALLMSFKLTIGRVGFAAVDLFPNEAIVHISVKPGVACSEKFLAFWLENQDHTAGASRAVKGNTLNKDSLSAIPVLLPPTPVQARVVDLMEHVDHHIASLDAEAGTVGGASGESIGLRHFRARLLSALLSREIGIPESYDVLLGVAS